MRGCASGCGIWRASGFVRMTSPGSSAAPKTLRKRLRDELDLGVAEANATIAGYLFAAAKAGNIAAIIFWLKTRAHWRERNATDDPVPGADGPSNCEVLLLPHNGRDPELTEALREAQDKFFAGKRQRRWPS